MASVGIEWINNFPPPCDQPELSYCDETSRGFRDGMVSRGHTSTYEWADGNAFERDFRDVSFGGDDANWVDNVDFMHFSSHGSTSSANLYQGYLATQVDSCTWKSSQAKYGDNWNLEYLCLDTCNSIELSRNVIAVWQNTFQGMRMIFGFTGVVSDSWWTGGRGNTFANRAGANDILSNSWLDACYSDWADDNPAVMTAGRSQADAIDRLNNERINSGFSDIPRSQITWFQWKWRS